jgi:hypothetical protein
VIDEDTAHRASGHGQEVRAVLPRDILSADQSKIGLIDERRRLNTVAGALVTHLPPRDLMKLSIHKRNQLLERGLVTLSPPE